MGKSEESSTSRSAEEGPSLEARLVRASVASRLFGTAADSVTFGPYRLLRRIGAGGMGTVFEADDSRSGQRLALKVLHKRGLGGLKRLKQEFRSLAGIQHPNLVRLYELSVHDTEPFLTMELIQGGSIFEYVRPRNELSPERLRDVLRQLIDAVSSLHAAGTLHCDLKPPNLLVRADGRLVLLDFGLAHAVSEQTDTPTAGTRAYAAPERLRGDPASEASDWYSAGMLVHQLLTGISMQGESSGLVERSVPDALQPTPAFTATGLQAELVELCSRMLDDDPERRPKAPELRTWAGLPAEPLARPLRPLDLDGKLVGREVELAHLREAFARSTHGRTVVVHLRGEPGIGKTALVRNFIQRLRAEQPVSVLSGRCYEREYIPYNAADGLVDALAQQLEQWSELERTRSAPEGVRELVRLFPVLGTALPEVARADLAGPGADPHRARQRAFAALRSLLRQLAGMRPLVIHLDDLQWGDDDSAQLLLELMQAPAPAPMLLIASYRSVDTERAACVRALLQVPPPEQDGVSVLDLGPLSEAATLDLARALGGTRFDDRQLHALSDESAGVPLFLRALVQHQAAAEPFRHTNLQQVVRAILQQVAPTGHELLQLVAVADRPLERELLLRAARMHEGQDAVDWHEHLVDLQRVGLLRIVQGARDEALESYHDRVREIVAEDMSPEVRRSLHARLAQAETASPAPDPEFLAHQYEGAEQLDLSAHHAELAGDRAFEAIALDRAVELYSMALRHHGSERPTALLEKLANAANYAGRSAEAAPLYLEAAGQLPPDQQRALRMTMRGADMFLRSGQFEKSSAIVKPVLRAVGIRLLTSTPGAILSLLIDMVRLRLRGLRVRRARRAPTPLEELRGEICFALGYPLTTMGTVRAWALQLRSMFFAVESGVSAQLARSLAAYAWLLATLNRGSSKEQDRLLAEALDLASTVEDNADVKGWILGLHAATYFTRGEYARSLISNREAQEWLSAHCVETAWRLAELDIATCLALVAQGEIVELGKVLPVALRRTKDSGSQYQSACIRALANSLLLAKDHSDAAWSEIEELSGAWPSTSLATITTWRGIATRLYRGEAAAAWDLMMSQWSGWSRTGYQRVQPWNVSLPLLKSTVALACMQEQGEQRHYLRRVTADIAWLKRQRGIGAEPSWALLEAGLLSLQGERVRSAERYARAADGFADLLLPCQAAMARMRQAELLEPTQAAPVRAKAQAWCEAQGIVRPERWIRMYAPVGPQPG
jgi:tetratricopeptide (TPR) repeat protein